MRCTAELCLDKLASLPVRKSSVMNRVLVVRLDAIGDFVMWLDAAKSMANYYQSTGCAVLLVANSAWANWARTFGIFDTVIGLDVQKFRTNLIYRFRLIQEIRALGCGVAINPTYSRNWLLDDAVIRISGASERIASVGDPAAPKWKRCIANRWYTKLIASTPESQMEFERNAEFLRNFLNIEFRASIPRLEPGELKADDSVCINGPYYVLFPGASWEGKRWPISGFRDIAQRVYEATGWQGIVCGGPSEVGLGETLCRQSVAPLRSLAGQTDLTQLAIVLAGSRLLLTCDTAAVHIAAACGTPTVCVLGGGHYGRFLPYTVPPIPGRPLPRVVIHEMPCFGCAWDCVFERQPGNPVPCIGRIHVEDVWRVLAEVLSNG